MSAPGADPLLGASSPSNPDVAEGWSIDPWDAIDSVSAESAEVLLDPGRHLIGPLRLMSIVLSVVVVLVGATGWWTIRQLNPSGEPGVPFNFTVNDGDTLGTLSKRLKDSGVILNRKVFEWYVRSRGGVVLTPGYYSLRPGEDAGRIIETLSTPPAQTFVSVTFPEGMTIAQMAARLSEKITFMKNNDFIGAATDGRVSSSLLPKGSVNLEGLLFPDT
jgi:UPF0755 protein